MVHLLLLLGLHDSAASRNAIRNAALQHLWNHPSTCDTSCMQPAVPSLHTCTQQLRHTASTRCCISWCCCVSLQDPVNHEGRA
jgi:hypothetical protein